MLRDRGVGLVRARYPRCPTDGAKGSLGSLTLDLENADAVLVMKANEVNRIALYTFWEECARKRVGTGVGPRS